MPIAGFHVANELRRFKRARLTRLTIIALILIPLLYSALYLWAFWNPLNKTDALPVALVNSDQGAELDGEETRAGDQVVQGLRDNDQINWTEVSSEEAEQGVKDGKYYFSLELPENFSEAVTSAAGTDAEKARLITHYNDANGYLSTIIGENVMREVLNTVGTTISAEAVDKVLVGVLDAGDGMSQAADGAGQLADGTGQLVDQLPQLTDGMDQLKDGSSTLAAGAGELNTQVQQLSQLVDGTQRLGDGAGELSAGVSQLTGQLGQVTTVQGDSASKLRGYAEQLRSLNLPGTAGIISQMEGTASSLETEGLGPQSSTASDLQRLDDGASQLAYQLSDPSAEYRAGVDRLPQLIDGVGRLDDGAKQLDDGLGQAQAQLPTLVDGASQLDDGANELHDRLTDGIKQIPTWNEGQRVQAATTIGGPLALASQDDVEVSSFGTGLSPFFISLALFIGGIVIFQIFKPLQQRAIAAGVGSLRAAFDGYLPVALLALCQALVMVAVCTLAVGLRPANVLGFTLVAMLVSLVFIAMNHALVSLLGSGPGRVGALIALMVMMVTSGGIYPVQTQNGLIEALHPFNPMTYAVNALRQMLYGFHDERLWTALIVLVATLVVALLISTLAARMQRSWSMKRLHPVLPN
ncbi:YhgE/Pip family protein [Corynebacterium variabile]|uniref:YhgE/Pip family protein n=1 Tax=Corynebacterium variabile TaxID=1727 RepID=UPI003A9230D4